MSINRFNWIPLLFVKLNGGGIPPIIVPPTPPTAPCVPGSKASGNPGYIHPYATGNQSIINHWTTFAAHQSWSNWEPFAYFCNCSCKQTGMIPNSQQAFPGIPINTFVLNYSSEKSNLRWDQLTAYICNLCDE